jgi:arylsulfatase A-like enzyme
VARWLDARLGARAWLSPLGDPTAALIGLLVLGLPVVAAVLLLLPQLRPLVPWRHLVAAGLVAVGTRGGLTFLTRRGALLPTAPRWRLAALGGIVFAAALAMPVTLIAVGADPATKSLAVSASPPLRSMVDLLRRATDFDHDGYGTLLGENDCAPFDPTRHPLARDLPDNRIDENCDGRDFELGRLPSYRKGKRMPVPAAFKQKWNVLLVTIDTVRYDHTTMGGYARRTGRDTTPELARLAARSTSFTFANAPSAGTMASIPAILTSKFFHSGIALDETVKKGLPPRLKPENLLMSELFKAAGFRTGAILSHEWFNDWGMTQGFDSYDNLVPKPDPFGSSADRVTDAAVAWIGQRGDDQWFLWLHYIDPHGRYVAHPGERSFGVTEEDLYDGELVYTDKHLGRLFDEIGRLPGAERTIIAVTSDHGDGFNEHGFTNHGAALYRELLHIPLIVFVPNLPAREVGGAVSPLDLLPTLIDLCGLAPEGAEFEGESLVPQLFYGQDASERVVFAETNAARILRAAVTGRHKLVYDLKANVYELFDLRADPWEKKNLWPRGGQAGFDEMKRYLDDWLERVYFARDPDTNQAMAKIADYLLTAPPDPKVRLDGASLDAGAIEVLGFEGDKESYRPGEKAELSVYFHAVRRPSGDMQFQIEAWRAGADVKKPSAKSSMKATAGGLLPTSRWRDGEFVRDRIKLRLPEAWGDPPGGVVTVGLRVQTARGKKPVAHRGPSREGAPDVLVLGEITLDPPAPKSAVPPGKPAPGKGR